MNGIRLLATYLFWPAVLLVTWGELSKGSAAVEGLIWDKALHFTAYFGLSGMICLWLRERRRVLVATFSLVLFAGVLEILQGFTGRDPSLYDEFANSLGAVAGALTGGLILKLLEPKSLAGTLHN